MNKKILIAAAWPYANGSLHLGHVAALIGSDILARYFRLKGDDVLYVSGSDCHGTPIAVEADRLGIPPADIAAKYHAEFSENLIQGLGFSYDIYTTTTTTNHAATVQEIFLNLHRNGHIYAKTEDLPYCPHDTRFLPDRYVEGECPHCHFGNARGDQCDNCGKLLDPHELKNPRCKICGTEPVWKPSEHFYLRLSGLQEWLTRWVSASTGWRLNAKQFAVNLLAKGLIDRAITRDTEWGVPIPLPGYESKRIYVWFEAVCGYLSASKEWATKHGASDRWKDFWLNDDAIHYYVHGKDNIPFHTIIWPAILHANGGLHLPDRIVSSEYLTLEHRQLSKSRHWAVWLPKYLKLFDPDALRYDLVASGPETSDADFSWADYRLRINGELISTFGNLVNRALSFVKKHFPDGVRFPETPDERQLAFIRRAETAFTAVGEATEAGRFREGLRAVIELAEHGNRYINDVAPWVSIKTDPTQTERDLAVAAHVIHCLAILITPYLPRTGERIVRSLSGDLATIHWKYPSPTTYTVGDIAPLFAKIEEAQVAEQVSKLGSSSS